MNKELTQAHKVSNLAFGPFERYSPGYAIYLCVYIAKEVASMAVDVWRTNNQWPLTSLMFWPLEGQDWADLAAVDKDSRDIADKSALRVALHSNLLAEKLK